MAASHDSQAILLREDDAGVATLTLNRPRARNALSVEMLDALKGALDAIAKDEAVRVVVLAGSGPAFCAGHDLKEMRAHGSGEWQSALFEQCSRVMMGLVHLPKPVIARVHGVATAAGCQLVASCDLAIAADTARFATPGVNIGLFCSTPMVALTRAVGRKQSLEMLLTGEMIDAEKAVRFGLINRAVPEAELDTAAAELAAVIASKSPLVLALGKDAFYRQAELDLASAYAYTSQVMARNMEALDAEEGITAFIEKRDPVWKGR